MKCIRFEKDAIFFEFVFEEGDEHQDCGGLIIGESVVLGGVVLVGELDKENIVFWIRCGEFMIGFDFVGMLEFGGTNSPDKPDIRSLVKIFVGTEFLHMDFYIRK